MTEKQKPKLKPLNETMVNGKLTATIPTNIFNRFNRDADLLPGEIDAFTDFYPWLRKVLFPITQIPNIKIPKSKIYQFVAEKTPMDTNFYQLFTSEMTKLKINIAFTNPEILYTKKHHEQIQISLGLQCFSLLNGTNFIMWPKNSGDNGRNILAHKLTKDANPTIYTSQTPDAIFKNQLFQQINKRLSVYSCLFLQFLEKSAWNTLIENLPQILAKKGYVHKLDKNSQLDYPLFTGFSEYLIQNPPDTQNLDVTYQRYGEFFTTNHEFNQMNHQIPYLPITAAIRI